MRTTLDLDENLLEEAVECSKAKSKTEAVSRALKEFIRRQRLQSLLELEGKIEVRDDWKEMEELELRTSQKEQKKHRGSR